MTSVREKPVRDSLASERGVSSIEAAFAIALIAVVAAGAIFYAQRGSQERAMRAGRLYETYNLPDPNP